jgi:eukaryotic-like serine/threonine-protein kinase
VYELDPGQGTLTRQGVRVRLQEQPFCVLCLLLERPGELVTREQLRQTLWPADLYVNFDGSLNTALKRLRAALLDDADNPRFIETVPRHGYRFIAPVGVEVVGDEASGPSQGVPILAPSTSPASAPATPSEDSPTAPRLRITPFRQTGFLAVAIALAVIGAGWMVSQKRRSVGTAVPMSLRASAHAPVRKSVAILGFHNVSERADDAWLGTAFSEMLSTELAAGEKLRLIPGEEVANLREALPWPKTDSLDAATTGRLGAALNSDLLVLGSYTAVGDSDRGQLRLDARLQEAATGEILSEIAASGSRRDIFQLASSVGGKLREKLGVPQLGEQEQIAAEASVPSNREAAKLYAVGVARLREFDALAARDLLLQVSRSDPKFAFGHAMLARAWHQLGYEQKRKADAKMALQLSADLPRVDRLQIEGDYYESLADHEKAASTYRALFELFPDSVDYGLQLAAVQNSASHGLQAIETLHQLRRLPPPASDDPRLDLLESRSIADNKPRALALVRDALRKASAQGKKLVYAQARKEECMVLIYSGQSEEGLPACQDAYDIYQSAGNRLGAADALRLIADNQGSKGHLEQSLETYGRALKILRDLGEHRTIGAVLNNMAINFANEGDLNRAEQLYRDAKFHFEQCGDKSNVATAIGNIADILYLRGDLAGAEKLYRQSLDVIATQDHGEPGYIMYRLADLKLARGQVQDAHALAQKAVEIMRASEGEFQYLTGAMIVLGEALKAEGDLAEARKQYDQALALRNKLGSQMLAAESQVEIAELTLDEGHPIQAEPLLRSAITEFEKEKGDPDSTSAYTILSRTLLLEGKLDEARKAIEHAGALSRTSPDPALRLPVAIQSARIKIAMAHGGGTASSPAIIRDELRAVVTTAKRLGYYAIECEARLALGELDSMTSPSAGREQLAAVASKSRTHGLELLARQADRARGATSESLH